MDTCFPLLKLKHHCVRATGEKRNQPRERGERERGERGERGARESHCWSSLSHGDCERTASPGGCRNSPGGLSWAPQHPQLRRRALNKAGFTSFHTSLERAGHLKAFFQSRWGEGNPHLRVGLVWEGIKNKIIAGAVYILGQSIWEREEKRI